jgi:hypothetical protein
MAAIYSNGGNRWNILGFNFTKRDALSSVYKISMPYTQTNFPCPKSGMTGSLTRKISNFLLYTCTKTCEGKIARLHAGLKIIKTGLRLELSLLTDILLLA